MTIDQIKDEIREKYTSLSVDDICQWSEHSLNEVKDIGGQIQKTFAVLVSYAITSHINPRMGFTLEITFILADGLKVSRSVTTLRSAVNLNWWTVFGSYEALEKNQDSSILYGHSVICDSIGKYKPAMDTMKNLIYEFHPDAIILNINDLKESFDIPGVNLPFVIAEPTKLYHYIFGSIFSFNNDFITSKSRDRYSKKRI